ncbi:MAG: tetratricopeptide repeat protein [Betaproteobacteria bacterium]
MPDRAGQTVRFWSIALRLRATVPPLRLPARTGGPAARLGFLAFRPSDLSDLVSALSSDRVEDVEEIWLYTLEVNGEYPPPRDHMRFVALNGVSELQAARTIAEADLDVLVDLGMAMADAPLLIALQPARFIVAPLLDPACHGDQLFIPSDRAGGADVTTLLRTARAASRSGSSGERPGLDVPAVLNAELNRGVRLHHAGQLDAAAQVYSAVLLRYPRHPIAAYMLGQLTYQQGNPEQAVALLQDAVRSAPEFRDAHYTLAQRLADCRRWNEAATAYRRVVELTPDFAAGWSGLGLALLQGDAPDSVAAVEHLERAVQIEPDNSHWRFNLGFAWQTRGSLAEARAVYQQVLVRDQGHDESLFNLGSVAHEQGDFATAIGAYRQILQRQPGFPAAYVGLGTSLQLTGQIDAWVDNFHRFRGTCQESLAMAVYALEVSMAAGDATGHCEWRDRILSGAFPAPDPGEFVIGWEQLLFLLLHVDADRQTLRDWYDRYDAAARQYYGPPLAANGERRPGPLRIGYVSGDLREHVMGRMIFEWVSRHDRDRFDVRLYSLSARRDAFTERFVALGLPLSDVSALPHRDAAARIRGDDVDLLIDCCGHTRGAQPGIFAVRPARVSATHIAMPGPLGLCTVDYKLTDALAEAADNQRYLLERLVSVEGGVYPWRRYSVATRNSSSRAAPKPGTFVCGTFVTLMKLSPRCLALWRRILQTLPEAVLAFSPQQDGWKPAYVRWLQAHGIPGDRVTFLPCPADPAGQLARYAFVDAVLDPLPCGNVNGTMEALSMGVPVVTLTGLRHGERLGHTLLTRFGVTDTIAGDDDAYVEAVRRIARDSTWAADLRGRIRRQLVDSPVWDASAQVRHLEAAYTAMLAGARPTAGSGP